MSDVVVPGKLGMLFHQSPHPMWVFDQQTLAFLEVNQAAISEYGFSRAEFLSMSILDIRPLEDVRPLLNATLHPDRKGASHHECWRHRTKDGTVFPVEITSEEIQFQGHAAEVVIARPVARTKANNFRLRLESARVGN